MDAFGASALFVVSTVNRPDAGAELQTPAVFVLLTVVTAVLAVRRKWPLWTLVVTGAGLLPAVKSGADLEPFLVPVMVATYTVAARTDRWTTLRSAVPVVLLLVVGIVLVLPPTSDATQEGVAKFALVGMAGAVGEAVRSRRAYIKAVEDRAIRAERTREEEARRRVAEERLHIARELHDIVAHHIAVITVQAAAAEQLVGDRPEAARAALTHVRRSGRAVLDELRGLLGVLRRPDDPVSPTEPAPGVAQFSSLVELFRASGLDLKWTSAGESRPLPETVDLVAYRVVQEALTNAHRHGTGTAHLSVTYTTSALVLEVVNAVRTGGRVPGTGLGLVGMSERTGAVGGTVRAGAGGGGLFRVHVSLPYHEGDEA
ncbi:histidine kinase [Amycolatopsis sp. A133]|uniref:sensor histidine kinase n=1 Tax=Amycolatopsis sp. A133 TaxID=3064472 RepID=UPI0027ECB495|nr:histidine kinase [Amycolatopsis sp. A133]MDQ7807584.1 histidine kinase [Amycolatopsis sp. A133]